MTHRFLLVSACCMVLATAAACRIHREAQEPVAVADPMSEPVPPPEPEPQAGPSRVADVGFATPESALYVAEQDYYLVSNINGEPLEKDDNGFISIVSPPGELRQLRFIDGAAEDVELDAPKGMGVSRGQLFVADIDVVRVFELPSGRQLPGIEVPGATFLNDITVSTDGTVYVSDTGLTSGEEGLTPTRRDAIYRIGSDGAATSIASGVDLGLPNGIAATPGGVRVVSWTGKMYTVESDGIRGMIDAPSKQLDGVLELSDGRVVFSSWESSAVYVGAPQGPFQLLLSDVKSPADIGFDSKRSLLLVPLFNENTLLIRPLR